MTTTQSDYSHLVIDNREVQPDWDRYGREVTKIVLGNSPTDDDAKAITIRELPHDLAKRFPALSHLYLWTIEALERLPELPPSLRVLDVRGCSDLLEITELPDELETLDIGYCTKLAKLPHQTPKHLQRFFFDACQSLSTRILENMLDSLNEQDAPIVEIQGTNTPAVVSLREFPSAGLKKLVLRGCEQLSDATNIAEFKQLDHLDLQDCTKLVSLPDIPQSLRYLALHGAEKLTTFMGQSIGPYDRGTKEKQNVAPLFHTRRKFGGELTIMPHAKLLLMGDGRVGKTTLSKRLQWEELSDAAKQDSANQHLEPSHGELFTHKVQFWRWITGLTLRDEARLNDLRSRAESADVRLPTTTDGLLDGAVRIWDFGGQELYHNTHRIFASEGSIFLVVWRAEAPDPGSPPDEVSPEEWKEWNRQRSLDYWLDYIYSMRPDAKVALVCANCKNPDKMTEQPNWRGRAERNAHRDLPCFFVDSLDELCGRHLQYQRLVQWIREACGQEADRIGILQPTFFRNISDQVDQWLEENSHARNSARNAEHLLLNWQDWHDSVAEVHERNRGDSSIVLEPSDVMTITNYLHDAGHLFHVRHDQNRAVLIDQEWAADLIYDLLLPTSKFRKKAKTNGGWFYLADLENDPHWNTIENDAQKDRLLAYMQECRVITRIADRHHHRFEQDVYLASDKWLLPTYESVEARVDDELQGVRDEAGMVAREKFEFEGTQISEFEFRSLQAHLAGFFGTRAIYFRNGLQAMEQDEKPDWCFRVRWLPNGEDAFMGKIDAVLVSKADYLDAAVQQIEELFFADASPLADARKQIQRKRADEPELRHEFFRSLRDDEYDVALSSSGADKVEAAAMVASLESAGLKVNWYKLPDCRLGERERVMEFMNTLRRPKCIILLVSAGYFHHPLENWYCPWELADAIDQISEGKRTTDQTIVVFKESDGFKFGKFDFVASQSFKEIAQHFKNMHAELDPADWAKYDCYYKSVLLFSRALETKNWNKFSQACGSLGSAFNFPASPSGDPDFADIIAAIKRRLGRKS